MTEIRESKVEKYLNDQVEAILNGESRKFTSQKNDPDRILILPYGTVVFVEVKRPSTKPNAGQLRAHKRLREKGFKVYWCNSKESVDKVIGDIKRWQIGRTP